MNSNHRMAVVPVLLVGLLVLLAARVPAQAGRQAKPPAAKGAASTSGPLDARKLCDIGAKSLFRDPVTRLVPRWQAEEAACYGSRVLAGDVRNVNLIVRGARAADAEIRSTIQIYFMAGEGVMVATDDLKAVALPLVRAFFTAAGDEAPADLLRDIESGVQGRLGTDRVPVETASGRGYYKIIMFFPGRTIE